ncbi:hypothetical protein ASN18_1492 [Candidatus Magnetominusculus xianensis]|uniref:Secreted protein n=1 Tax=Candidatus Magnetominusculus xianensis TaxID=1748249 RepID=A0ABR5SFN5_9BACT|nr:hypothetical protein ASN18_1492 [Candidatus Magnetominusculus xianensis]
MNRTINIAFLYIPISNYVLLHFLCIGQCYGEDENLKKRLLNDTLLFVSDTK